ncbi:MAG: class I SAM-dependent methyltransferase [Planctomycetota bacterium]
MASDPLAPGNVRAAYDRRARWYDGVVTALAGGFDGVYRREAVALVGPARGGCVVEVGAGTGLNLRLLRDRLGPDAVLVACDASAGMLREAAPKARRVGAHLVRCDGAALPFRDECADALIATYVVSTVAEPEAATANMLRLVRPGGRIVLTDDRLPPGWFLGPLAMLRGMLTRGWRDSFLPIRDAVRRRCSDLQTRLWHGGLIWLVAGTKAQPDSSEP